MKQIQEFTHSGTKEFDLLLDLWEDAVRQTHTFLSEADIMMLKPMVKKALQDIGGLYCYVDEKDGIQGFMGVDADKIEMLFIRSGTRGKGIGRKFIAYAIQSLGVCFVDVNEQNKQAVGFYEHMGFQVMARSPLDGQGNPFPILHMKLAN